MTVTTELVARNKAYSDGFTHGGLEILPSTHALIVTCVDSRVDPFDFLNLAVGEALIVRKRGGRVDEGVIRDIAILNALMSMQRGDGSALEVLVIHHTDCGLQRLSDPAVRAKLESMTGIPAAAVEQAAFADPAESVAADVATLRSAELIPDEVAVNGFVYDVRTGLLTDAS